MLGVELSREVLPYRLKLTGQKGLGAAMPESKAAFVPEKSLSHLSGGNDITGL